MRVSGGFPDQAQMNDLMGQIIKFMGWYDQQREGYVNGFPSELDEDTIKVEPVIEGGQLASFIITLPFKKAVIP